MPRKILLIESDAPFAREMASALEEKGFETQVSDDGKEGLDIARDLRPAAIVLCVELPKMSGYSICNKLKKDDDLRSIPLVIISAEATPETFEQHKKLKTRAEDYLIKPFPPSEIADRVGALVGAPGAGGGEDEVVTLADVELEALGTSEPSAVEVIGELPPPLAPPRPRSPAPIPDDDEDLKLLDDAFESIAAGAPPRDEALAFPPPKAERPVDEDEIDAAAASLPEADEGPARAEIDALGEEADAALAALGTGDEPGADESLAPPPTPPPPPARPGPPVRGASADALRAAGIPILDAPVPAEAAVAPSSRQTLRVARDLVDRRPPGEDRDREVADLRQKLTEAQRDAERRDAEAKAGKDKLDAIAATVKRLETDLKVARDDARRAGEKAAAAEKELAALRDRVDDAERAAVAKGAEAAEAAGRTEALERELEELRTELVVARGEAEGARGEVDKRTGDLRRRLQELEAASAKNEERVVKAYQKIKGDEKLREKTRKALTIALQLLDERAPGEPEKDRSAARE